MPDLTHLYAQYALIEPWLETTMPEPDGERLRSPGDAEKLNGEGGKGPAARTQNPTAAPADA